MRIKRLVDKLASQRSLLSMFLMLAVSGKSLAQVSFGGNPASFTAKAGSEISVKQLKAPFKNLLKQARRDAKATAEEGALPRVGVNIPVSYDIHTDGTWSTLPDGRIIWRLRITSADAPALILAYDDFYLPEGTQLYLYNDDHSNVLGAYTYRTHPQGGPFSTEMTFGDAVTLEMVYPADSKDLQARTRLHISSVAYCYNHLDCSANKPSKAPRKEYGSSSDCMINVNNTEGKDWQTEKDGVVRLLMYFEDGIYVCSGTMINNTAEDLAPYLLTAYHCYCGSTEPNLAKWQFYFHYESPGAESAEPLDAKTLVGCTRKSITPTEGGSDGMLIELSDQVPEEWNVYFNGWDRRNEPVEGRGVCIHHPAGDIKKISTFDRYESGQWTGQGGPGAPDAHWQVKFVQTDNGWSQVEGGSSGSPLFASNHLVVGTLTGGGGGCTKKTGTNYYGKLWYHWNQYGQKAENHMQQLLDPLNTGAETLRGIYYNPTAPRMTLDKEQIELDGKVGQDNPDDYLDIKGYNLTKDIQAMVEGCFELSVDEKTWGKTATLGVDGARLYVRYVPENIGNHTGTITIQAPEVKRVRTILLTASSCNDIQLADALPNGEVGQQYEYTLQPTGSEGPFEFKLADGTLPKGLAMTTDGKISGTIEKDGNYPLTVSVTDKYGCVSTCSTNLYVRCMVVQRFPYAEDFEQSLESECWKQSKEKGDAEWTLGAGVDEEYEDVTSAHDGQYNAVFNDKAYNENTTLFVSPQLDFTGYATGKLSFYRLMPTWDGDQDELKVYYRTSAHGKWQELATYNTDTPEWTLTELDLPDATEEYFIAFGATGNYGHGIGIDDITVSTGMPSAIQAVMAADALQLTSKVNGNELTLGWQGQAVQLSVFDAAGQQMAHRKLGSGQTSCTISTEGWAGNAYILVLTTADGSYKQKIYINK